MLCGSWGRAALLIGIFELVLLQGAPDSARAQTTLFQIDPAQSELSVTGSVSFDFPNGTLTVPLVPQGSPGVGAVLPSGATSDGLTTFATGTLAAEVGNDAIRFRARGTSLLAGTSGSWLPGAILVFRGGRPDPVNPADAVGGASFTEPTFGVSGNGALRELSLRAASVQLPLTETAPGSNAFSFSPDLLFVVLDGFFDIDTNLLPKSRRIRIEATRVPNLIAPQGTLERLPDGSLRLTVPVSVSLPINRNSSALPVRLGFEITGQLVAVPEPSASLLIVGAAIGLAGLARRRRRS